MNSELAMKAKVALAARGFESRPGYCWKWIRQVLTQYYGGHKNMPPVGVDAKEAMEWYQKKGWALPSGSVPQVGDLIFWVGDSHGVHGHVAMRILGNLMAENSSLHASGKDREARGVRPLPRNFDRVVVVRLPVR